MEEPRSGCPINLAIEVLGDRWSLVIIRDMRNSAALAAPMLLAACATQVSAGVSPQAPGFLLGLWHGFIFPVAWFLSLILPDIAIYAVPNNGGWYDFGYFLGIVVFGVGANRGRKVVYRDRIVRERHTTVIDHE